MTRKKLPLSGLLAGMAVLGFILLALPLLTVSAGLPPLAHLLQSNLRADYSADQGEQRFGSLRLSIIDEILSGFDALPSTGNRPSTNIALLQSPVPSATQGAGGVMPSMTAETELDPSATGSSTAAATFVLEGTPGPDIEGQPSLTPSSPIPGTPPTSASTVEPDSQPSSTASAIPSLQPTPSPTSLPAVQAVNPVLQCVSNNSDGSLTAFFGYNNPNAFVVELGIGGQNRFAPPPQDRGQPTRFESGQKVPAFSVTFEENNLVWILDGKTVKASSSTAACTP